VDLANAFAVAHAAVAAARTILLAECARPDGPRGEIGHCPADDEAEWAIRDRLLTAFPTWGYVGEETGVKPAAGPDACVWFVDPNDGTASMQRGARGHAISIGLVRDGIPILGVVCAVDAPDDRGDVIAWAEGCGPLRRNGVIVTGGCVPRLDEHAVIGVSQGGNRNPVGYAASCAPARFMSMPSIAYRLALVAVGEYAATVSLNELRPWDYMAGHALVHAVGGVVLDASGNELTYDDDQRRARVFAGSPGVARGLVVRNWTGVSRSGFGATEPPAELAPVRLRAGCLEHRAGVLSRAQGCLLGQIAGDALGALVEFETAESIVRHYPGGGPLDLADGGPHSIIAGQPTDDSELALVLARTIVARSGFDLEAVAAAYAGWFHGWTHALEPRACLHRWCRPFDVGSSIARALTNVDEQAASDGRAAAAARSAANADSQANGGLMRVSPLGIWGAFRNPAKVADAARSDSALTHPHPVCQDAAAAFTVTLARAISEGLGPRQTYASALEWCAEARIQPAVRNALESAQHEPPHDYVSQQGWVLIAFQNAYYQLLHAANLEEGVVATVRAGGDTDTNAAICGALLGAVHGRDQLPLQWRRMVLSCRPMPGLDGVRQPRPALFWATDALVLAERLLGGD
jgi:ADP-ribosylglycohydrolase/fructose-1,6-bisphosphatase/inositol monophosphatase family enzyme